MTTSDTVDLTPAGLRTQEGIARVNAATERMHDTKAALANFLDNLCKETGGATAEQQARILHSNLRSNGHDGGGFDCEELAELVDAGRKAEEEFLRALCNRPKAA